MGDTTGWLLASNGSSVHKPLEATKDWPYPTALCGRRGLSRIRTTCAEQDGKETRACRNCERAEQRGTT